MGFSRAERVKLDFTKELFNTIVAELKQYEKVTEDDEKADVTRLINNIAKYTYFDTDTDGTEYAIMRLFSTEASRIIYMLSLVASIVVEIDTDYYSQMRAAKEE
jgi:hypothetical protein